MSRKRSYLLLACLVVASVASPFIKAGNDYAAGCARWRSLESQRLGAVDGLYARLLSEGEPKVAAADEHLR